MATRTKQLKGNTLTDRQWKLLAFIVDYTLKHFYQPSVREMCRKFCISSPNGIMCHLRALEHKGFIDLSGGQSRAIRIKKDVLEAMRGAA